MLRCDCTCTEEFVLYRAAPLLVLRDVLPWSGSVGAFVADFLEWVVQERRRDTSPSSQTWSRGVSLFP